MSAARTKKAPIPIIITSSCLAPRPATPPAFGFLAFDLFLAMEGGGGGGGGAAALFTDGGAGGGGGGGGGSIDPIAGGAGGGGVSFFAKSGAGGGSFTGGAGGGGGISSGGAGGGSFAATSGTGGGVAHGGEHPREGARLDLGEGFVDELWQEFEGFADTPAAQEFDHAHIPEITGHVLRMFL